MESASAVAVIPVIFEPSPTKPPLALITPLEVICEEIFRFPSISTSSSS